MWLRGPRPQIEIVGIPSQALRSSFAEKVAYRERPRGWISLGWIARQVVHCPGIRGRRAAHPVRLRSSVSWAIQVFSGVSSATKPSVFSS